MAVTNFSPLLGLALPTTGDLSGTWGTTVNDSITQLLDSAVAGTTTLSADADVTLSTTNGAANQARNAVILWTASNGGTTRNITAPAQSKAYVVINSGTGSIVVRGAGPTTGVTVPSGTKALVAWNGSDFVKVASNPAVLTTDVSGILPIANGGTGTSSTTFTNLTTNVTGTLPVANGGTGITSFGAGVATFLGTPSSANLAAAVTDETGSGSLVFATSPTLVTPALGTPSSGTLTNATGLPIDGGTTGTLPVARGGTGTATPALVQGANVTITGTWPNQTIAAAAPGTGTVTSVAGTGTVNGITLTGTVTSTGNLTLGGTLANVGLTTQVTGTLPVANGGTGAASLTTNNVLLGNGTSALQVVAPGTTGNVLTSDGTTWTSAAAGGGSEIVRVARTSNVELVSANNSDLIDITSGTFTQTFDDAASLGSGWFCYIRNSGTGDITLDPDGAETIDGLATYIMYPGEVRLVQCDGTALRSIVLNAFYRTFTASGTFTKPPGYAVFEAFVWSGGCSGGRSNSAIRGGPGGGGFPFTLRATDVASSETVTVGSGGTPQTGSDNSGNAGGASSIGTLAEVAGAQATQAGNISIPGYGALVVDSGTLVAGDFRAGRDNSSVSTSTVYGGASGPNNGSVNSGNSFYGGAAGGSHDGTTQRLGGTSKYGGNGGNASVSGNGLDGAVPGGGGGSARTATSTQSGAGARGEVRIWGII
jgi:hypothetical protein